MKKLFTLFVLFGLSASYLLSPSFGQCIGLDSLVGDFGASNAYPVGTYFTEEYGVNIGIAPYTANAGSNPISHNSVNIGIDPFNGAFTKANGSFINSTGISTLFDFTELSEQVIEVSFDYIDNGGNNNLSVNGTAVVIASDLYHMSSAIAPGVTLEVDTSGLSYTGGTVWLNGPIDSFYVGGGEFAMDNICFKTKTVANDSCVISEVEAIPQICISNQFYIDLYFTASDPGASGFSVSGNGTDYGTFDYGQAYYTFGPFIGDGMTDWEFVVSDLENPNCSGFTAMGFINCNPSQDSCYFSNIVADPIQCTSDTSMSFYINFATHDTGDQGFQLKANGVDLGIHPYSALPLTLFDFPLTGNASGSIEICDQIDPNCCIAAFYTEAICDSTETCHLDQILANAIDCNLDGTYILDLIINQSGYALTDSFDVFSVGQHLGTFAYSLDSLRIPSFIGSGFEVDEISICHQNDPNCCLSLTYEALICNDDCFISEVILTPENCEEDGQYYVSLDLEYRNPGFLGFQILGNGNNYGIFQYENLPIRLGPFEGDSLAAKSFIVLDQTHPICANQAAMDPVYCIVSGLWQVSENQVQIYTDASTNLLLADFGEALSKAEYLTLFNSLGQNIKQQRVASGDRQTQMDLSDLGSGIYFVAIKIDGQLVSRKIYHQE